MREVPYTSVVWNAAAKIQHNIGAISAYAFEVYALCAGALLLKRNVVLGVSVITDGSLSEARAQR